MPFVPVKAVNYYDFSYASCDYFTVKEDEICKRGVKGYTQCLNSFRRRRKQCTTDMAWWNCNKDASRFALFCKIESLLEYS